jgi:ATP-binding cassette subfamily C protein/ATP-binding cassette subfamily C protein CydC
MPPLYALTLGITAVRALGIGRAVLRYGERYFTHAKAFQLVENLRLRLYDIANNLANQPLKQAKQGTMLNALLANAAIWQEFFLRGLLPPAAILLTTMLLMMLLHPVLGCGVVLLPLLYISHLLPLWFSPAGKARFSRAYRSTLLDYAQGSHELLTAGTFNSACDRLDRSAGKWQEKLLTNQKQQDQIDLSLSFLRILTLLMLLALLIDAVQQEIISGIELSLWLLVLLALMQELVQLPPAVRHFQEAKLAAKALQAPAIPKASAPSTASELLTVQDLAFHYPQSPAIFTDLSFSITSGCHTAIIGDSGSGKTTLAYLLAGLWQPTNGTISYTPTATSPICAIPQGSFLFSQSIRENFLRLHPDISEIDITAALQAAQLSKLIKSLPKGIDTPLGDNACTLSGGERNRLITALILASKCPLLLFDEPTAGLDQSTAEKVLDNIIDRSNLTGQTVIVITHDLPQLHRFSKLMNMRTGLGRVEKLNS